MLIRAMTVAWVGWLALCGGVLAAPEWGGFGYPSAGLWVTPGQPGKGQVVQISPEGRVFVALYHYDEDGAAAWLTMQGSFENTPSAEREATGIAGRVEAPVLRVSGGSCLGCPPRDVVLDAVGNGEVVFRTGRQAEIRIGPLVLPIEPFVETLTPGDYEPGQLLDGTAWVQHVVSTAGDPFMSVYRVQAAPGALDDYVVEAGSTATPGPVVYEYWVLYHVRPTGSRPPWRPQAFAGESVIRFFITTAPDGSDARMWVGFSAIAPSPNLPAGRPKTASQRVQMVIGQDRMYGHNFDHSTSEWIRLPDRLAAGNPRFE